MSDSAGRLVGWNTFGWMLDSSGCLIWLDVSFGWMSDSDGCLNGEMCHMCYRKQFVELAPFGIEYRDALLLALVLAGVSGNDF